MDGKNRQERESLCEKSMQLMMNVIKVSAFSLATTNQRNKHGSDDAPVGLIPVESFKSSPRSQAPLISKSYLMEQDTGDHNLSPSPNLMILEATNGNCNRSRSSLDDGYFSDYIKKFHRRTKNEVNTDGKATAYVRKFHEKNSRDHTLAAPTSLPMVVPPPPSSLKK